MHVHDIPNDRESDGGEVHLCFIDLWRRGPERNENHRERTLIYYHGSIDFYIYDKMTEDGYKHGIYVRLLVFTVYVRRK